MNTTLDLDNSKAKITEQALDHGVDALAVIGIVVAAYVGTANTTVVGGLVSIALGKRVIGGNK